MERKKSTLTPDHYSRAIKSFSGLSAGRGSSTSVFPGNNYIDLAEWMLKSNKAESGTVSPAPGAEPHHDLVVVYNSGDRKWEVQQYSQDQHDSFSTSGLVPEDGTVQLVFMRGLVSPSWMSAIGSKYQIDPEFFRRHMDNLAVSIDRHAFSLPSLPSTSRNMFKLCVSTILHRDHLGEQNLQAQRKDQSRQLSAYKTQQLGSTKTSCGDSLVRDYSTLCSSFSVLEQMISICITKHEKGWTVVAWMDQGRPLEKSPAGPWTSHIKSRATALPILQTQPKMTFRATANRLDAIAYASADVQQSATILPLRYDSLVALVDLAHRAPQDPLSMCIPVFADAAFSELQFLNLLESKIQLQVNALSEVISAEALDTFQFFSNILNRHMQHLKESLRSLCRLAERSGSHSNASNIDAQSPMSRNSALWRRKLSDTESVRIGLSSGYDGTYTSKELVEDYEDLHARCVDLSLMCTRGITLAMNKATIDESRNAIEQSERVKKLTLLATFFIPLSFSSSLFGMNIDLLGQSKVKTWWFFVLCVPITLLAYALYLWDWPAAKRIWAGMRKRFRRREPTATVKSEKDSNHIV